MTTKKTAYFEKQLARHKGMIYSMARRYFDEESLVDDAVAYISDKLAEDNWQRMRAFQHKSSFKTFLASVVRNLTVDFYRHTFGRPPQTPKWICRRGFLWEQIYTRLCLRRWRPSDIIEHFRMRKKDPAMLEEAIFLIKTKVPDCGQNGVTPVTTTDNGNAPELKPDSDAPLHQLAADEMDVRLESEILLDIINTFLTVNSATPDTAFNPELQKKMQKFRKILKLSSDERIFLRRIFEDGTSVTQAGRKVMNWNANQSHGRLRRLLEHIRTAMLRCGLKEELSAFLK